MAVTLSTSARNAQADATIGLLDAGSGPGTIKLYTGGKPASPEAAATGTLLATVVLPDPASTAASNGTDTIIDPASVTYVASGTAAWARLADSAGNAVMDVLVSDTAGTGDIKLSSTTAAPGITVDMAALPFTVLAS